MHRRTRDDEIAHAGKTGERLLAPTHALGQAREDVYKRQEQHVVRVGVFFSKIVRVICHDKRETRLLVQAQDCLLYTSRCV